MTLPPDCPVTDAAVKEADAVRTAERASVGTGKARWNNTPQGVHLNRAWEQMTYAYQSAIPRNNHSLALLAQRPIGG